MGVAFAGNMMTLFVFYEVLTISTYPLVTHKGTDQAMRGGRTYLGLLLFTSIGLQLLAILWTWQVAGTLDFTVGGILTGKASGPVVGILLLLYVYGIGKAALMPFHRWLPAAMVAPTPVSALLHAVAVVKVGVFTVMKVVVYIFGIDLLAATGHGLWLTYIAAATLLLASLVALSQDNLKARLAYSTVSQLAYVVLGAALANPWGVIGGSMHIAMHAMGKITLFFCAGAIYTATRKTEVSQMTGLGRIMPFTFGAFLIGSLSIIGLPPLGGAWGKWYLMLGAAEGDRLIVIAVLMISSLLNVAYLIPIVARGFFLPSPEPQPASAGAAAAPRRGIREAPLFCVVPLCLTALGCLALFFFADPIYRLLEPIAAP
jgi:multicomponent Na+:H+ antiporter subunit D